jgi:hypothetical protein
LPTVGILCNLRRLRETYVNLGFCVGLSFCGEISVEPEFARAESSMGVWPFDNINPITARAAISIGQPRTTLAIPSKIT